MNTKQTARQSQPLPTSLTESGQEARRKARDTGTLRGWWRCAIGDLRDLLAAAKYSDDVEDNLDMAYAVLEHLRLVVQDRDTHSRSCQASQPIQEALSCLSESVFGAIMDILLATEIGKSVWGVSSAVRNQINSVLRQLPTRAGIGKLARELGSVPVQDAASKPMVRCGVPTRCRYCGL